MLSRRIVIAAVLALSCTAPAFAYNHARRGPTSPGLFKRRNSKPVSRPTGPRAIEPQRATEIQSALIKAGFLTGTPSGHWDAESQAAMQKLQASKGWQTKLTPDSRALILLGLGPQETSAEATSVSSKESSQVSERFDPTRSSGSGAQSSYSLAALGK